MTRKWIILLLLGCLWGCQTTQSKNNGLAQKEMIELKKENFDALYNAIGTRTLRAGTNRATVRDVFGEPEDIYSSMTGTGTFEIWSYEDPNEKNITSQRPIRLYFDNERLLYWAR